jgi:hypothetical protein
MSPRASVRLAWSLCGLSLLLFSAAVVLFASARLAPVPDSRGAHLPVGDLLPYVPFLAFPVVGALVASRRPENPVGWLCLAVGLLWMFSGFTDVYGFYGVTRPGSVPFPIVLAGINNFLWVPSVGLIGTYLLLLFPDGALPSRRWQPLAWLCGAVLVSESVGSMLSPGPLQHLGGVQNPFGLEGAPWVEIAGNAVLPLLPLCMLASALSLVMRYRRAGGEEREQIKWIASSALAVVVVYMVTLVISLLSWTDWFVEGNPPWLILLQYAAGTSLTVIPIAVGFAVLKYRLYEIDILINRALVYGSLTVVLAASYEVAIVALQEAFRALTGQGSGLAIVASTLAIAALFHPARRRIQGWIDRRFYRRKYDAAKTLEAFSARLREETELGKLSEHLLGVVSETMQPTHVSLWLRPEGAHKGEQPQHP